MSLGGGGAVAAELPRGPELAELPEEFLGDIGPCLGLEKQTGDSKV